MKVFISFIALLFLLSSCKKEVSVSLDQKTDLDTIDIPQKKTISSIGESLDPKTKQALKNWEEYQLVDEMLTRFYAISNAEALSNATELSKLTKHLKDSIRDVRLETPSVKARLNLLYTESKRLEDMNAIPAIKQEEITIEIKKILEAFSAVNAKFNSVLAIDALENELDLDPDFQAMINNSFDSIKVTDKIASKKTIDAKKQTPDKDHLKKEKSFLLQKNNKRKNRSSIDLNPKSNRPRNQKPIQKGIDKEKMFKKNEALKKEQERKQP